MELDIYKKDENCPIQNLKTLLDIFYNYSSFSDVNFKVNINNFISLINNESNLLKSFSLNEKIGLLKRILHSIMYYLTSNSNSEHFDIENLISALLRLCLRQELSVYVTLINNLSDTYNDLLKYLSNRQDKFEIALIHFQHDVPINIFKVMNETWIELVVVRNEIIGFRLVSMFSEILNLEISTMIQFGIINIDLIQNFICCIRFGDFHAKIVAIDCLYKCLELKRIKEISYEYFFTSPRIISIVNLLIEFSKTISKSKLLIVSKLPTNYEFNFNIFEMNFLKLFRKLIELNEGNDFVIHHMSQKIKEVFQNLLIDQNPDSLNIICWPIIMTYCDLVTSLKDKFMIDNKLSFLACVKSVPHISDDSQFQKIIDLMVMILKSCQQTDFVTFETFISEIIEMWKHNYRQFSQNQNPMTIRVFILNSRFLNLLLLKNDGSVNREHWNQFHLCLWGKIEEILNPNVLFNVIDSQNGSVNMLEILSLFIEEFSVSIDFCKYNVNEWIQIVKLITIWYFKEEYSPDREDKIDSIYDRLVETPELKFNRIYSYYLLSFIPNEKFAKMKSNILKILWDGVFCEKDLFIMFESLKNNIIYGTSLNEIFNIIESIYDRYKEIFLASLKLTEKFCDCLNILHCKVCNGSSIIRSVKRQNDTSIYYPLSITIYTSCSICSNEILSSQIQKDKRELQFFIIKFIMNLLKDYLESKETIPFDEAFKSLLLNVVNHCNWSWEHQSISAIVAMFRICFQSSAIKLQYDCRLIIFEFAKKLVCPNQPWPLTQQALANIFEELIDKNNSKIIRPVIYSLESLLKIVPIRTLGIFIRLICKIAYFPDQKVVTLLRNTVGRVLVYREISEEQLVKQWSIVIVEVLCSEPDFQQWMVNRLSEIFNLSYTNFYKMLLPHIFIYFVIKGGYESHQSIQRAFQFVTWVNQNEDHFNRVIQTVVLPESIVHFYLNFSNERFNEIKNFLNDHFSMTLEKLILYNDVSRTIHSFMVYLSEKFANVLAGIKWIALDVIQVQGIVDRLSIRKDFNDDKISKFLREYSVGILEHFKLQLLDNKLPSQEHERVISSLQHFIRLIKNDLKNIHIMCSSILKTCLKFTSPSLMEKSYTTWYEFITLLDFADLEGLLVESIAVLLFIENPLINRIKDILLYIFNNENYLKTKILDLHFILELPSLSEFHDKLLRLISADNQSDSFISILKCCNRNLHHENSCVRYLSANHLFTVLSSNLVKLSMLMAVFKLENETNTDNMDLIHSLNHSLMSSITEEIGDNKLVFSRCLGLLGAVDSGRYRELTVSGNHSTSMEFVTSPRFSYEIMCELGKFYLGITTTTQMDAMCITIQELIKTFKISKPSYDCSDSKKFKTQDSYPCAFDGMITGHLLWEMIPGPIKEIFQPFLNSRYKLLITVDWSHITIPLLTLSDGMKLDNWICTWTGYLVHLMKNSGHISVFTHFQILIKNDAKFAKYILRHVILALLIENNPDVVSNINLEIISIFKSISRVSDEESHFNVEKILNNSSSVNLSEIHNFNNENTKILQSAGQIIFKVLDYLQLWLNMTRNEIEKLGKDQPKSLILANNLELIKTFVRSIPNSLLAVCSFKCGSLARSVKHWMLAYRCDINAEEDAMLKTRKRKEIIIGILQVYSALHDSDEITGYLSTFKSELEPFAQTLKLEYEGKYDLALSIYEQQLLEHQRKNQDLLFSKESIDLHRSSFRCQLFNISALPSIIARTNCCLNDPNFPLEYYESMNSIQVEALYKIGDWKRLETSLNMADENDDNWTISVTKALCQAKNQKLEVSQINIDAIWKKTITNLEVSSVEGFDYERVHTDLSRFARLTEIEMILATKEICAINTLSMNNKMKYFKKMRLKNLPTFFNQRYKLSETNFVNQESLLTSHFNLFQLISDSQMQSDNKSKSNLNANFLNNEIGQIWLQRCKIARRAGLFASAMACLMNVEKMDFIEFSIEKGKLFWKMGRVEESLGHLDEVIENISPLRVNNCARTNKKYNMDRFWKLLLLRAHLTDVTCRHDFKTTKEMYKAVFEFESQSEVAHFRFAHFLDETLKLTKDYEETLSNCLMEYGNALMYGCKFVYQSMPRLLSLWLDKKAKSKNLGSINAIMKKNIKVIPKFQFYVALYQIISRLCHEEDNEILTLLNDLVVQLMILFPQQTIWSLICLNGSSIKVRRNKFDLIFAHIKNQKKEMQEFIHKMINLSNALREIGDVEESFFVKMQLNLKKCGKSFDHLLKPGIYSGVILPLYHQLFGTLPTPATFKDSYLPFPSKLVCISHMEESADVLPSLTKPKKMIWIGTDGKKYIMIVKPKDDLRRDCRIMELNGMFNRLMRRNSETRHRLLYIRTYAVTPLGEKSGLIEWVNNTESFRQVVVDLHIQRNNPIIWQKLHARYTQRGDSFEKKLMKFTKEVLPLYPVVFNKWFLQKFPEPNAWYRSVQKYCRSVAVMSMVGYILGLGDRHIENILFDHTSGDVVHIDYNCLFNHGKTLEWPEVVPFRLTRNMQDGLGPCGENNGLFRSSCVATLNLLRNEIEPIMAVFKPMYYDTLTEVKDPLIKSNKQSNAVTMTENKLEEMENRLKGKVNQLPLSVEGEVNYLIAQAIDEKLLCQMYMGWGSFI